MRERPAFRVESRERRGKVVGLIWENEVPLLIKLEYALPHLREKGTSSNVFKTFARAPWPESGLDCLVCVRFDGWPGKKRFPSG